jgi:hypothetical protein
MSSVIIIAYRTTDIEDLDIVWNGDYCDVTGIGLQLQLVEVAVIKHLYD